MEKPLSWKIGELSEAFKEEPNYDSYDSDSDSDSDSYDGYGNWCYSPRNRYRNEKTGVGPDFPYFEGRGKNRQWDRRKDLPPHIFRMNPEKAIGRNRAHSPQIGTLSRPENRNLLQKRRENIEQLTQMFSERVQRALEECNLGGLKEIIKDIRRVLKIDSQTFLRENPEESVKIFQLSNELYHSLLKVFNNLLSWNKIAIKKASDTTYNLIKDEGIVGSIEIYNSRTSSSHIRNTKRNRNTDRSYGHSSSKIEDLRRERVKSGKNIVIIRVNNSKSPEINGIINNGLLLTRLMHDTDKLFKLVEFIVNQSTEENYRKEHRKLSEFRQDVSKKKKKGKKFKSFINQNKEDMLPLLEKFLSSFLHTERIELKPLNLMGGTKI